MADKTLDVLVRLGVIGKEDVKAVNDLLGETAGGTDKLTNATEEAAKSQKLFAGEGRESHRIIGEINRILPGTGNLFREAFNPTALGAVGILIGLLFEAKKALDEYNKSLDEQGAEAAKPMYDGIVNLQTAWDDAKKKFGDYQAAVDSAGKDRDAIDEQIKKEKELTDAKLDGIKKIIEELGREEVARLKASAASPEQIKAAEEGTRKALEDLEDRKKSGDATRLQEELSKRNAPGIQAALDFKAKEAADAAAAAGLKSKNAEDELKNLREANSPENRAKLLDPAAAALDAAKNQPDNIVVPGTNGATMPNLAKAKEVAEAQAKLDAANAKIADQQKRISQLEADATELERKKATAEKAAATAAREGEHNAARVSELPGLLGTSKAKNNLSDSNSIIEAGVAAENAVQKSGRATKQQAEAINRLHDLADVSGTNMTSILRILALSHGMHHSQQQDIDTIKKQFLELASQRHTAP